MPKDEFDFEDPFELNGVGLISEQDTTEAMTECFIEEFMRLGHNHKQILALFRNPHYLGMNLALQQRGEPFVREMITEVFARWGRTVSWPAAGSSRREEAQTFSLSAGTEEAQRPTPAAAMELASTVTDPMGEPIPDVTI